MATRPRSLSMSDALRMANSGIPDHLQSGYTQHLRSAFNRIHDGGQVAIDTFLASLRRLSEKELVSCGHADSSCPICLNPFLTIITEEEMALALDSPAHPVEELGVTKLAQCGHLFCIKDIRNWVLQRHNSCPTCRGPLLDIPESDLAAEFQIMERELMDRIDRLSTSTQGQGILPLTDEQLVSLRSAIMLLAQGDDTGIPIDLPSDESHHTHHDQGQQTQDDYDSDRGGFGGMYS